MAQSKVAGDLLVLGNIACQSINLPAASVTDASVQSGAGIQASKTVHTLCKPYSQDPASAVVAATPPMHIANAAGTILSLWAAITGTIATGGDRTVTIDLKKSTGGGAFATVLASTLVFNSSSTLRTAVAASLGATLTYIAGDIFELVITVAGAAGAQALGLKIDLFLDENHQISHA